MPIGVLINALSVVLGGLFGALAGRLLHDNFRERINMIFGCCSMGMGISTIILMQNMPAVIFSLILGTSVGITVHLGDRITHAATGMQRVASKVIKNNSPLPEAEFTSTLVTLLVLFCASGTGIYGAMVSGMTGDHTILISKSILDLFTAAIFACSLGAVVALVAVPQCIIFLILFFVSSAILPWATDSMIADFKACGGFIMLATGFRMIQVKMFPVADMVPAMILVMPLSALWATYILPLVS